MICRRVRDRSRSLTHALTGKSSGTASFKSLRNATYASTGKKGLQPAWIPAYPTEAITLGDETTLASALADKKAKMLSLELGAEPKVYYAGLP